MQIKKYAKTKVVNTFTPRLLVLKLKLLLRVELDFKLKILTD